MMKVLLLATPIALAVITSGAAQQPAVLATTPPAPSCGEFLPVVYRGIANEMVQFTPKHCNQVMVAGQNYVIPPGVGVESGGVMADLAGACVDQHCGQPLSPNVLYYAYVFRSPSGSLMIDFSRSGHMEDTAYGNEVKVGAPGESLVGMIETGADGLLVSDSVAQPIVSWFNQGTTGLTEQFGVYTPHVSPTTCSPDLMTPLDENGKPYTVKFLSWGINSTFAQAFTVPNIYVESSVNNSTTGGTGLIDIRIDGPGVSGGGSSLSVYTQAMVGGAGYVHVSAVGAAGANEGWITGTLMMSTAGSPGCFTLVSGQIFTSPVHS